MKNQTFTIVFFFTFLPAYQAAADQTVENLLQKYQQQGAGTTVPDQGKNLWYSKKGDRSCTSCHGISPAETGKHIKTSKTINPMARRQTLNVSRIEKKEKWFLRNCKWTLDRQCTVQEKADTLSWLSSF